MNPKCVARQSTYKLWSANRSSHLAVRCSSARWYATTAPKKPQSPSSTSKKPTASQSRRPTTNSRPVFTLEEEETSIASRTPFKQPSTGGLGVASKSPSDADSNLKSPPSNKSRTVQSATSQQLGDVASLAGDHSLTAEAREARLRTARLRRVDQQAEREREEERQREYKQKYDGAARRWVSGIIATPILLVTSYYLFDRREFVFPPSLSLQRFLFHFKMGRLSGREPLRRCANLMLQLR